VPSGSVRLAANERLRTRLLNLNVAVESNSVPMVPRLLHRNSMARSQPAEISDRKIDDRKIVFAPLGDFFVIDFSVSFQ
jgi:hypothetical protein